MVKLTKLVELHKVHNQAELVSVFEIVKLVTKVKLHKMDKLLSCFN